jgi:hypothetical protein
MILPEFTLLSDCLRLADIKLLVLLLGLITFVARGLVKVGCTDSNFIDIVVFVFTDARQPC